MGCQGLSFKFRIEMFDTMAFPVAAPMAGDGVCIMVKRNKSYFKVCTIVITAALSVLIEPVKESVAALDLAAVLKFHIIFSLMVELHWESMQKVSASLF